MCQWGNLKIGKTVKIKLKRRIRIGATSVLTDTAVRLNIKLKVNEIHYNAWILRARGQNVEQYRLIYLNAMLTFYVCRVD